MRLSIETNNPAQFNGLTDFLRSMGFVVFKHGKTCGHQKFFPNGRLAYEEIFDCDCKYVKNIVYQLDGTFVESNID
ncbi:MAG: hypothetical protein KKA07_08945 [Bacteroidetes bacterium]|nr:hypothetical protein [Bacteroidota bacterium]MBU1719187.1 hypothetical protein [Bacteroidota bacterium]